MTNRPIELNRSFFLLGFYAFLGFILIYQLFALQVQQGELYRKKAEQNGKKTFFHAQKIGKILDRNGTAIAESTPIYQLILKPGYQKCLGKITHELSVLGIEVDHHFLKKQQERFALWHPLTLLQAVTAEQLCVLCYHLHKFPELSLEVISQRSYCGSEAIGLLTGYLKYDPLEKTYLPQGGIEKSFQESLLGRRSCSLLKKTAKNMIQTSYQLEAGESGEDLQLSIDLELQKAAYKIFEQYKATGSLIALDPKTGEIIALVSAPSYDPNLVQKHFSNLRCHPGQPLFHRSLQGLYPPASLLKPLIALAALEEGVINLQSTIDDPGFYTLPKHTRRYRDWKRQGHGLVNVDKALTQSCDTFFYDLGFKLGIDKMDPWLRQFGLGQHFSTFELYHEKGLVPSRKWKEKEKKESWYQGESLITAIGQGYLNTTPLHLAYMCSYFANKGTAFEPTMLLGKKQDKQHISLRDPHLWDVIHDSLCRVVNTPQGTAYRKLKDYRHLKIAGKTGTAQVVAISKLKQEKNRKEIRDHSLFIGYAPYDDPKIVLVVVNENQSHALYIAGQFLQEAFYPSG